jgi:hypothetical protein
LKRVVTDAEACGFPEARTLLSARTVDLAASEEDPSLKAESESGEITPGKGANILRHFISSLGPDEKTSKAMAEAIRAHWGCETRHWERDKVWCEDECLLRSPNAACALAMLRVATKAVLVGVGERSVTRAIEKARESGNLAISWIKERDLGG